MKNKWMSSFLAASGDKQPSTSDYIRIDDTKKHGFEWEDQGDLISVLSNERRKEGREGGYESERKERRAGEPFGVVVKTG